MQLRQLLRILQKHVDKVKDLLVVSGIKQTLLDMMYAKKVGNRQRMIKMEQVHLEKVTLRQISLEVWGLAVK